MIENFGPSPLLQLIGPVMLYGGPDDGACVLVLKSAVIHTTERRAIYRRNGEGRMVFVGYAP